MIIVMIINGKLLVINVSTLTLHTLWVKWIDSTFKLKCDLYINCTYTKQNSNYYKYTIFIPASISSIIFLSSIEILAIESKNQILSAFWHCSALWTIFSVASSTFSSSILTTRSIDIWPSDATDVILVAMLLHSLQPMKSLVFQSGIYQLMANLSFVRLK